MQNMSCVWHSIEDEVTSQFGCMLAEIYFVRLEDLLINCLPLEGPKDIPLSNTISSGLIREFQASLKNSSIFYPLQVRIDNGSSYATGFLSDNSDKISESKHLMAAFNYRDKMNTVTATNRKAGMTYRNLWEMSNIP